VHRLRIARNAAPCGSNWEEEERTGWGAAPRQLDNVKYLFQECRIAMSRLPSTRTWLQCEECGRVSREGKRGWKTHLTVRRRRAGGSGRLLPGV
jgi:hypothetical protein